MIIKDTTTKVIFMQILLIHLSLFNSQSYVCFSFFREAHKVLVQLCYFYTSDRPLTLSNMGESHTLHSFKQIQNQNFMFTSRLPTVTDWIN